VSKGRAQVLGVFLQALTTRLKLDLALLGSMETPFRIGKLRVDLRQVRPLSSDLLFDFIESCVRLTLAMFDISATAVERLDLNATPIGNRYTLGKRRAGGSQLIAARGHVGAGRFKDCKGVGCGRFPGLMRRCCLGDQLCRTRHSLAHADEFFAHGRLLALRFVLLSIKALECPLCCMNTLMHNGDRLLDIGKRRPYVILVSERCPQVDFGLLMLGLSGLRACLE
jgi:hypothetical protein